MTLGLIGFGFGIGILFCMLITIGVDMHRGSRAMIDAAARVERAKIVAWLRSLPVPLTGDVAASIGAGEHLKCVK
jgi:hypothetical protein